MLEAPATLAGNIVFNTMLSADCLMTIMRRAKLIASRLLIYKMTLVVVEIGWFAKIWEIL